MYKLLWAGLAIVSLAACRTPAPAEEPPPLPVAAPPKTPPQPLASYQPPGEDDNLLPAKTLPAEIARLRLALVFDLDAARCGADVVWIAGHDPANQQRWAYVGGQLAYVAFAPNTASWPDDAPAAATSFQEFGIRPPCRAPFEPIDRVLPEVGERRR